MSSDIARVSYDAGQQYHAVVMQQGRVTIESDWNEAQTILNEEMRKEALAILGPAGTFNKTHYAITQRQDTAAFDFVVNPGVMYVGGMRASLDQQVLYSQQSDWLDHDDDADWVEPAPPERMREFIYLHLYEQEVSAVEDSALREVALGGPDTAARLRLIQHIVRLDTDADTCDTALADAEGRWAGQGLKLDRQTLRLQSRATLKVDFTAAPATAPNPCETITTGGYVGPDNQLIRVQISGNSRFVWGFDNASSLYRVDVTRFNVDKPNIITLQSPPIPDVS